MREPELRLRLQRCCSRIRLARAALNAYQAQLMRALGPVPVEQAAALISDLAAIDDLLGREEGRP
jgi:hypothetical protein